MSFERKIKRKQQLKEIHNTYCPHCGTKLTLRNGKILCLKCGEQYGRLSDRI